MSSKLSLLLDKVPVDDKYTVSAFTDVNMAFGCINSLVFEPWKGFSGVLNDGLTAVNNLSAEALNKAAKCVGTCAEIIDETKVKHAEVEATENRRNSLLRMGSGTKRPKLLHLQRPVSNSESLTRLHSAVFRLVENAIAAINKETYPYETLDIASRTCVSENLRMYVPKELRTKEPQEWVKLALPHTDKPDYALFCASEADLGKVPLCTYECKGPTLDISSISTVDREALLIRKMQKDQKREEQDPSELEQGDNKPNGPLSRTQDLDGVMDCENVNAENEDVRRSFSGVTLSAVASVRADEIYGVAEDGGMANDGDVGCDETNHSYEESSIYVPGFCASDVAEQFNFLFSDKEHLNTKSKIKYGKVRVALYPVAQVICQALVSQTGLGFLYNHQQGIAFKLSHLNSKEKLVIHVSGVIASDREPGNVSAMVSLGKLALDMVHSAGSGKRIQQLRRMMRVLSESTESAVGLRPPPQSRSAGNSQPGSSGSAFSSRPAPEASTQSTSREGQRRSESKSSLQENCSDVKESDPKKRSNIRFAKSFDSRVKVPGSPTGIAEGTTENELEVEWGKHVVYDVELALKTMFLNNKGVISMGSSGVLLQSFWKGREIVLKLWNRESEETRKDLQHEVEIYSFLREQHSQVLGSAVPKMIVAWDNPFEPSLYSKEVILVTEYVGWEVVRDASGVLWVGHDDEYECVEAVEEQSMGDSAMLRLQELHSVGIVHGDVALRNLRVQRIPKSNRTESNRTEWRAWWVDLGKARCVNPEEDSLLFQVDENECKSLFQGYHQRNTHDSEHAY